MEVKATACALLMFLLFSASQLMMPGVEARVCRYASRSFRGLCFSDTNCAHVCQTEGFNGGHCHGLRRRCMCLRRGC
ncbi:unnamed protein product [Musa acuminata subsp. malaccensis]|uniref:(wild Malaysian banana) hypothetical protein n=1 Tax=Musa acuminata subsp. malaccensis TaxID=214687 RepID=A0A804L795_MUSAM|nr:unnamed protein product [Musa acuminata subsp. malaccensis]